MKYFQPETELWTEEQVQRMNGTLPAPFSGRNHRAAEKCATSERPTPTCLAGSDRLINVPAMNEWGGHRSRSPQPFPVPAARGHNRLFHHHFHSPILSAHQSNVFFPIFFDFFGPAMRNLNLFHSNSSFQLFQIFMCKLKKKTKIKLCWTVVRSGWLLQIQQRLELDGWTGRADATLPPVRIFECWCMSRCFILCSDLSFTPISLQIFWKYLKKIHEILFKLIITIS